jgi:large subunit ribosomal protein L23
MAIFGKKTESAKKDEKSSVVESAVIANPVGASSHNFSIIQPRISEKAAKMAQIGKYVFLVNSKANKVEVKKAVEKNYKVHVTQVNIVRNKEKAVTFGRFTGERSGFKKAIVTLKKGESIEAPETK